VSRLHPHKKDGHGWFTNALQPLLQVSYAFFCPAYRKPYLTEAAHHYEESLYLFL
jgi:hypothetical protein